MSSKRNTRALDLGKMVFYPYGNIDYGGVTYSYELKSTDLKPYEWRLYVKPQGLPDELPDELPDSFKFYEEHFYTSNEYEISWNHRKEGLPIRIVSDVGSPGGFGPQPYLEFADGWRVRVLSSGRLIWESKTEGDFRFENCYDRSGIVTKFYSDDFFVTYQGMTNCEKFHHQDRPLEEWFWGR